MNGSNRYYPHLVDYNEHREMTRFERRALYQLSMIKIGVWGLWWFGFSACMFLFLGALLGW